MSHEHDAFLDPSWGAEKIGTADGIPVYRHRNGEVFVIRVLGNTVGREVYGGEFKPAHTPAAQGEPPATGVKHKESKA